MAQLKRYNGTSWEVVGGIVTGDTLPIGSEVDYDGISVPAGWEEVDDPNVYSTNETKIGTWLGESLYRKVITGNLVSGDLQVDLSSLNIKELVNSYGRCGTTGNYRPLNFYLEGYYVSTRYSGGSMYVAASGAYAGEPFKLVIEYTKN